MLISLLLLYMCYSCNFNIIITPKIINKKNYYCSINGPNYVDSLIHKNLKIPKNSKIVQKNSKKIISEKYEKFYYIMLISYKNL